MLRSTMAIIAFLSGCAAVSSDDTVKSGHQFPVLQLPPLSSELRMELSAKPMALDPGDTLTIRLTVSNDSQDPVSTRLTSGCIYGYSLWNTQGHLIAPPPMMCTMNAPVVKYDPGESRTIKFIWVWEDMSIKPGAYDLYAGFGPRGEKAAAQPVEIRLR